MLHEIIGTLSFLQPSVDDDFIDRLNYYHTSTFLIIVAIVVSFKMFAGRPLECWVPAEYTSSWEDYSEMFCWAQNTYYVPFDAYIPKDISERERNNYVISYYQWLPFFLLAVALSFYLPCIIWRIFNNKSGIRLTDIVMVAKDQGNVHPETRTANQCGLSDHLLSVFRHQFKMCSDHESLHRVLRCFNCRYYEGYLIFLYLSIKAFYLLNSAAHLFLMNKFLQTDDYTIYGVGVLGDLLRGHPWTESGNFPRVTLCDMQIRVLGNVQRHTVQCVLVINIFAEKIFILLWIWYTLLSLMNFASCIYWIFVSLLPKQRLRFITRNLQLADKNFNPREYERELNQFISEWIRIDGVFVLRIVALNTGVMFAMELVDHMWKDFLEDWSATAASSSSDMDDPALFKDALEEVKAEATPTVRFAPSPISRQSSVLVPLLLPQAQMPLKNRRATFARSKSTIR